MSAALLVVFYMLATYGIFGVFANLALRVHIAFHLCRDGPAAARH